MKTCVYPGSFDPITNGHIDIIKRAASTFDSVIVAIGKNPSKNPTFSLSEKIDLIKKCLLINGLKNVNVVIFDGLLADFAYENNAKTIIKGVRNNQDFDYERLLHEVSITQQSGIDTHVLISDQKLSHVSSTVVKELTKLQGLTAEYVPLFIKEELEYKLNNQFTVGITGEIGMGKSFVSSFIESYFYGDVYSIDLDKLAHSILDSSNTIPVYVELRRTINKEFGLVDQVSLEETTIDRKKLGNIVFSDASARTRLNELMRVPILTSLRKEAKGKRIVLLNGALLVEANFLELCNNNIIVVKSPIECQIRSLKGRGLTDEQIKNRVESQYSTDKKVEEITKNIKKHGGHGWLKVLNNNCGYNDFPCDDLKKFVFNEFRKIVRRKNTDYNL